MSFITKIFGDENQKVLDKLQPIVDKINQLEGKSKKLSNEQVREKTEEFKERLKNGESLDNILPEAFALVREAGKRALGERLFDVQILGGVALHQGKIIEMKTGEGKTIAATCPVYLNGLQGKGVHIVTVNDYLARRDTSWMGPIYNLLGLSVGCIQHEGAFLFDPKYEEPEESNKSNQFDSSEIKTVDVKHLRPVPRQEAYLADVTYGTNNEFGFDYLRGNMAWELDQIVQRELNFGIIDEVDSILIDEARTPLIISAPDTESTKMYYQFAQVIPKLEENEDYNIDEKMRAVTLTDQGIDKVENILGIKDIYNQGRVEIIHHLEQALKAQALFKRDKDYVIKNGEVIIVDDFTGRLMFGRRYSEGLHQAIEAKEGVEIKQESKTLATITFQNYFRLYKKLSGMTGTAATSAEEFRKVYNLDVVVIPTNEPMIREYMPDVIYKTEDNKFKAVVDEIKRRHERRQPVLVGTVSIEKNEKLSNLLRKANISHQILNAKHHEKEAKIIAMAGLKEAVTIATNMAGRGTDIKLGKGVVASGGLHIIGTERHEARRIDDQLRGRAGRQGDPGSSQFYVSCEDDLMRVFGGDKIKNIMDRLGLPDDQPIRHKLISKSIESAQKKVEGYNFDLRKHVLEYDDVMNRHREVIYKKRRGILENSQNLKRNVLDMIKNEIRQIVLAHTNSEDKNIWNTEEICEVVNTIFPLPHDVHSKLLEMVKSRTSLDRIREQIISYLINLAQKAYEDKEKEVGSNLTKQIEKVVLLRTIDTLWIDHLDAMDRVREGIGLRGYGQRDPLVEYKNEGYKMFQNLLASMQNNVVYSFYKIGIIKKESPMKSKNIQMQGAAKTSSEDSSKGASASSVPVRKKKIGRNEPCPCGSGKKYKYCCWAKDHGYK